MSLKQVVECQYCRSSSRDDYHLTCDHLQGLSGYLHNDDYCSFGGFDESKSNMKTINIHHYTNREKLNMIPSQHFFNVCNFFIFENFKYAYPDVGLKVAEWLDAPYEVTDELWLEIEAYLSDVGRVKDDKIS